MKQLTLAVAGFERYARTTRRAAFLAEMERVVPWAALCALIEPYYPKPGNGRPPVGLERMLRIYFLQQWFNLSGPGVEEALYNSLAMRRFVGIDLGREPVPDETTVCRLRHLLEAHNLGRRRFDEVQRHLAEKGLKVTTGTIVDATIINAPASTKNAQKARDPEMHQTKKGNQWYFGMKAHLGVDSRTKLIHAAVATPANVADSTVLPELLHGNETRVWGDQAYRGQRAAIRQKAPQARDFVNRRYRQRGVIDLVERAKNRTKSKVRAKVEHSIGVVKRVFGFAKVRYRGLTKNAHRLLVTCALANLFIARRHLLRAQQGSDVRITSPLRHRIRPQNPAAASAAAGCPDGNASHPRAIPLFRRSLMSRIRSSYPHWVWTAMVRWQKRSIEARISSADLVQRKGFGSAL